MIFIVTILLLVIPFLILYVFFSSAPQIGGKSRGKRLEKIISSPGYSNGKFQNVVETPIDMPLPVMMKTGYEFLKPGTKGRIPEIPIDTAPFDKIAFELAGNEGEAAITWFGHSSLLIKIHGKTFLTDPVLVGERASMVSFIGPKRFPYKHHVAIEQLPKIDTVLLSHDHYDHLDYNTILALRSRVAKFIVPLGVGAHLERWGIAAENIEEYNWWDKIVFDENINMVCTPSRHFSGRSLTERNTTLWCSWIIEGRKEKIYFGADSGYSPTFREIGTKYGPFDLTILECGAYSEYWPAIHMMPEETLQAHIDLDGNRLMPIHWGKFSLSLHGWKEPIQRLKILAETRGVTLVYPRIGQIIKIAESVNLTDWWEEK
ncbi:MAG: MBL fold metallo-hydrolase [Chitinophagaceae bacterium]